MPRILILPDYIASQIAAGEVIERPASVIKELVENSLDAEATHIEIAVDATCLDIRVADNGCGMETKDAVLAFQRHATSKLVTAQDLFALNTLGFRGEALPSIAAVAKVTCYTKTKDADSGTRVDACAGKIASKQAGCASGTAIEVCDLFYNVPARLKFLKKASTEFAHIHEMVQALAIAYPQVALLLLNQGEVVLKTSGSGDLIQAIAETKLLTSKENLAQVVYHDTKLGLKVYGYLARPPSSRGDRKGVVSIINNRPVRCPLIYKALDYAFSDLIPKGKYPLAVLTVTLDPSQIDVNVHPTKKEVKYSKGHDVYLVLQKALVQATRSLSPMPLLSAVSSGFSYLPASGTRASLVAEKPHAFTFAPSLREERQETSRALPTAMRIAGYIHNTYILLEIPHGLMIVEQHIAHERVLYEQLLCRQDKNEKQRTAQAISQATQHLAIPCPLKLSPVQQATLKDNLETLTALGFAFEFIEEPTEQSIICLQVPLELTQKDYTASIQENIEQLLLVDNTDFKLEATKSLACQAAVKNGMPLSELELTELLAQWQKCARNDTCPHGRPIALIYSKEKLFQLFH